MMKKFHINNDGEAKECRASKIPCRFQEHFTDLDTAQKAAEKRLEEKTQLFNKITALNNLTKTKRVDKILTEKTFDELDFETRKMIVASVKLQEKGADKALWQAVYDSTPAGQLILQRYTKSDKKQRMNKAQQINELVKSDDDVNFTSATLGKKFFNNDTSNNSSNVPNVRELQLMSASWMSNMSPDEIDTMNWITGHGAGILNKHLINEKHYSAHQYSTEELDRKQQLFLSAMNKAPEVDEPVEIYRGTKYKYRIVEELSNVASSSVEQKIAEDFTKNKPNAVVMKIRTNKVPSLMLMSDYGIEESEILAPLGKYRTVEENDDSIVYEFLND